VSEPRPTLEFSLNGEPVSPEQKPEGRQPSKSRNLAAALLSSLVPGSGQFLIGQSRHGWILLTALSVVLLCFWPLRLPRYYAALILLFLGWSVLYVYAACSALLARRPHADGLSKWWLLAFVPLALVGAEVLGSGTTRAAGFRAFGVPSSSMEKTISRGEHVVVDCHFYRGRAPERRDVIVFLKDSVFFVKRVVAISGDSVEGKNGIVLINGQPIDEPYVQHNGSPPPGLNTFGPMIVPAGKYFVMGDNRDVSLDSRSPEFGFLDSTSVVGKSLYVFGSDRIGKSIQ